MQPKINDHRVELDLENIPAFDDEEFAPPETELKPQIRFYYGGSELKSMQDFWNQAAKDWFQEIESFIGNRKEIRETAQQAIGGETDSEKKLKARYHVLLAQDPGTHLCLMGRTWHLVQPGGCRPPRSDTRYSGAIQEADGRFAI